MDVAIASAPPPYLLIFTILRETGMRAGEVLDLRWGDVLLDAGREALRVREAKYGTERTVILGPTATPRSVRGLRAARRARGRSAPADHEVVFLSNRGTRVSHDGLQYQRAKVCQAAVWSTRRVLRAIHPINSVTREFASSSRRDSVWRSCNECWAIATYGRRSATPNYRTRRCELHWKAPQRGEVRSRDV